MIIFFIVNQVPTYRYSMIINIFPDIIAVIWTYLSSKQ